MISVWCIRLLSYSTCESIQDHHYLSYIAYVTLPWTMLNPFLTYDQFMINLGVYYQDKILLKQFMRGVATLLLYQYIIQIIYPNLLLQCGVEEFSFNLLLATTFFSFFSMIKIVILYQFLMIFTTLNGLHLTLNIKKLIKFLYQMNYQQQHYDLKYLWILLWNIDLVLICGVLEETLNFWKIYIFCLSFHLMMILFKNTKKKKKKKKKKFGFHLFGLFYSLNSSKFHSNNFYNNNQ